MRKIIAVMALLTLAVDPLKAQLNNAKREDIVGSELNFASMAEKSGLKYAFENNLDSCGLIVNGIQLVNGLKTYAKAKTGNTDLLAWYPSFARSNQAGDFGFTTGPYIYYAKRGGGASASGNYFSIWKKDKDGNYKLLFDGGVNHSGIKDDYPRAVRNSYTKISTSTDQNSNKKQAPPLILYAIEVPRYLDRQVLILRADQPIRFGRKSYVSPGASLTYRQKQSGYDESGKMYYVVGNLYDTSNSSSPSSVVGFYAQVWHLDKEWKIVADVIQLAN